MARVGTRQELLARVEKLSPLIREHADQGERERHLMDPVVAALQDAGFFRMLVPRDLGGLQVDPLTFYEVIEALARVDGSTAWCMFNSGGLAISAAFLHDDAANAIHGRDPRGIMSGTLYPPGRAIPSQGGYIVSGRWVYASGCWHASWHLGACNVYGPGINEPRRDNAGIPEIIMAHFPRAQMQIVDTWDVSGLSATGSHDVMVEDVFVPDTFIWKFVAETPRGRQFTDPLYRFPLPGFLRWPIGAVALGIAQAAIDEITQTSRGKTPPGSATTLREQPLFQSQLSQAVALVRSARSWLHEIVTSVWEKTAAGDTASFDDRALFNLAGVNATRSALSAVELAYAAGGGSANYRKNPLQRHVRDIHAVTQHIGIAPKQYETSGRMLLGVPPDDRMLLL